MKSKSCVILVIIMLEMFLFTRPVNAYAAKESADIPNGIYYIETKQGNRLEIENSSMNNGATVQVGKETNGDNQAFAFIRLPDGTYKIMAYHSGLSLEVSNSDNKDGGRVQQWEFLEDYNCKRWNIYDCGNGWYKIVNKHSKKCLDIKNGQDEVGVIVQQYRDNGTDAQRFKLTQLQYSPQNYNRYEVGDEVYVTGKYYASSNGSGAYGRWPQKYCIVLTSYNKKYPYAIRPINSRIIYGWINESSISLPDYTEEIIYGTLPEMQYLQTAFDVFSIDVAMKCFYDTFKTGGRLDVKNSDKWNEVFDIPYPGEEKFLFKGMVITADQLGNILYGWIGSMLGINDTMLYWGGGFAHQAKSTGKDFWDVLRINSLYDPDMYYGDRREDHFDITRGILLAGYQNEYVVELRLGAEGLLIHVLAECKYIFQEDMETIKDILGAAYWLAI